MLSNRGPLACLVALALVCSAHGVAFAKKKKKKDSGAHPAVHWTYEGEEGPSHWSQLSPDYERCGVGKQQSPIDLTGASARDLADIAFDYHPSKADVVNNGHTIQVTVEPGSSIRVDGKRFDLVQFHFHAPSEHAIDGKLWPAELHLVHKSADGELAVVGLMIEKGDANKALGPVFKNMPAKSGAHRKLGGKLDLAELLPAVRTTFRYSGSLTTPPCSEGVRWHVVTEPIRVSEAQLAEFERLHEGSNRPLQPLHDRTLVVDSTPYARDFAQRR